MSQRVVALLDANVIYSALLRDILMQLAVEDVFQAKWSADIHREWIEALLRNNPNLARAALERLRNLMDRHLPNAMVTDYESLIDSLTLPDENDRHVLAAAITGECGVIVTQNLRDFPADALTPHEIEVQHPDRFLVNLLELNSDKFCRAVRLIRSRLKNPSYTVAEYLATLTHQGLTETATALEQFAKLI